MRKSAGLTLIEVLIALAIVSIAMTAVIKATAQNIRSTHYLQDKMVAMWVGQEVLNEIRAGVRPVPTSDAEEEITNMLGQDWHWQLSAEETPNKRIKKVKIKVFANQKGNEETSPLVTLESYAYHEE